MPPVERSVKQEELHTEKLVEEVAETDSVAVEEPEKLEAVLVQAPDIAQLEALVREYDDLHAQELYHAEGESSIEENTNPEPSPLAAEVLQKELVVNASGLDLPPVAETQLLEEEDEPTEQHMDLETLKHDFLSEMLEEDQDVLTEIDFMLEIESEFTPTQAAELDELLGFDEPNSDNISELLEPNEAEIMEVYEEEDFIEKLYSYVEALEQAETIELRDEIHKDLEALQELAVEVGLMKVDTAADTLELEDKVKELEIYAEKFLTALGKAPSKRVVKRFVERLVHSELRKLASVDEQELASGTHEYKLFKEDTTWSKLRRGSGNLVRQLGSLIVSAVSYETAV